MGMEFGVEKSMVWMGTRTCNKILANHRHDSCQ